MSLPRVTDGWRTLQSEILCDSPHLSVFRESVATPTRPGGVTWMVARRRTAAVVAPRQTDGRFILIRQERVAVRQSLWEFPAGQVDEAVTNDSLQATARRELQEEAGVESPRELVGLGYFYSSVGFTDECCHLFLAADVVPTADGPAPDAQEAILETGAFTSAELRQMVAQGEIVDANTLALYARLCARDLLS